MTTATVAFEEALGAHPVLTEYAKRAGAVALTVIAAYVAVIIVRAAAARLERRLKADSGPGGHRRQRVDTVLKVAYDIVKAIIVAFAVMTALADLGVSVQPLVAGAGLVGAGVAFGSQAVVKDFVAGFFILLENHFDIGDTVVLAPGVLGTVEKMTLRVTIVRDSDGSVHIVPNGTITTVTNRTYDWSRTSVALQVALGAEPAAVRASLQRAAEAITANDAANANVLLSPATVGGPNLREKALEWTLSAKTQPGVGDAVRAAMVDEAVRRLRDDGISLALASKRS